MAAYNFRVLEIDLTSGHSEARVIPDTAVRDFLGGASLAAHLLYPSLVSSLDPGSVEAPLLFLNGPLTGTAGPAVGRFVICGRSPATGLWGESNAGGFWGPELRGAGYDGLLITGASAAPVYLWIHDERIEIRDAARLWGRADTYETQAQIRAEVGDNLARVACIGPAGEAGIPFGLILCDHGRVAGRTGTGAVMGAKRLKAVAVRGSHPVPVVDPAAFQRSRREANLELREDNVSRAMRQFGTSANSDYFDYLGEMPKRYFTRGVFDGVTRVSGVTMAETILSGVTACHACVIACGRRVRLADGAPRKGPEYETIAGFGPNLEIDDLVAVTRLGELCDRYGLDSISMSNTVGLAFLLFQEGILTRSDADGDSLQWGDGAVVERLIHKTVRREGLGALLALGARGLAEHFGMPELAAQVNGLEVPYHDPRGASGMALVYATSPRGACHNQGDYFLVDTMGQTADEIGVHLHGRHAGAEKSAGVARHQDWRTVGNSLVLCHFANVTPSAAMELINQVTGFDYDLAELMSVGERGWNLKRAINLRLGLTAENDRLPGILLKPYEDGGAAGYVPPLEEMLHAYYAARDWDPESGRPTRVKLQALGLRGVADDLWGKAG